MQISGSKREIPKQEEVPWRNHAPLPWGPEPVLGINGLTFEAIH